LRTFILGCLVFSLTLGAMATSDALPAMVALKTGTSEVLHSHDIGRIAIGDPAIIGALPLPGKRDLLINAKAPGRTTLFVWTGPGAGVEHDYQIVVTANELDILVQMLRTSIVRNDIHVDTFDKSIVLRGAVPDGAALQQVSDILARFDPVIKQYGVTVVNAVVIAHALDDLQHNLAANREMAGVRVDPDGQGNVIVSGRVKDEAQRQAVIKTVRGEAGRYLSAKGEVVDRLSPDATTQVNIKVRILEIDKSGLSQLGTQLQGAVINGSGAIIYTNPTFPIVEQPGNRGPFQIGPFFRATLLAPTIDLLVQSGDAKILSEPNLTTVPGQDASFLVGGQIPIPQSAGLGQVTITYQNYGVQLNVNPTILGNGDVATKIAPEVSDLDFQNGVAMNGFTIPALTISRVSTNIVTAPGESIVMAGLLRHIEQRTIQKIPLLSQLPILGRLFQDVRYQNRQTDVIFVMTPEVITR
jgi:Flp pilus assembly secretin CpaC